MIKKLLHQNEKADSGSIFLKKKEIPQNKIEHCMF